MDETWGNTENLIEMPNFVAFRWISTAFEQPSTSLFISDFYECPVKTGRFINSVHQRELVRSTLSLDQMMIDIVH